MRIYVVGTIPGLETAQLPRIFSDMMNALRLTGWAFAPGSAQAPPAADRVQWTIKPLPYAGGAQTRIGRLLAAKEDLFGHYRYVKVEVRLYLGGTFQTMSFTTSDIQGGANDPKLAAIVRDLTGPLLTVGLDPEQVSRPAPVGRP